MELPLLSAGHLLLSTVLSLEILLHKERPVSAVLWLGIVWAFPYLGALAYATFGVDRVRRGAAERRAARHLLTGSLGGRAHPDRVVSTAHPGGGPAAHILRATDPAVPDNLVLRGNRVELLVDGDEFYPALEGAIDEARESIHLQTFIFARDDVGRRLRDHLAERARDGIRVRVLYDRFGSTIAHFTGFFEPLRRAGAEVHSISQANPLKGRFQINLRNHRKVTVVDGRTGFAGGLNIARRNLTDGDERAHRDYHLRIEGPAVADLQRQFLEDWHFATGASADRLLEPDPFPGLELVGEELVQVVPGGPEEGGRRLAEAFFGAMVAAERSLTLASAYFIPDEPILQALRYAALRGVDVRLVLPARSNHWYAGFAARALYGPLLEAGVRIYERGPPFMHAKALLADDVYSLLGSANLDYRSLHLNFELNVEVVGEAFARQLRDQLAAEMAASREVTLAAHLARPLTRRLLENLCRLFQPVL